MSKNESRESSILVRRKIDTVIITAVSHLDRRERPDKVPKTYKDPLSFGWDDTIKLVTVTKESMTVKN